MVSNHTEQPIEIDGQVKHFSTTVEKLKLRALELYLARNRDKNKQTRENLNKTKQTNPEIKLYRMLSTTKCIMNDQLKVSV